MRTRRSVWVTLAVAGLVLLACTVTVADDQSTTRTAKPEAAGISGLLDLFGKSSLPSLSGLIKPEKMGVLTDNQCRIKDNEPHLLSDNEATVKLASDIQVLSGITVNVHISVQAGRGKTAEAKKGNEKRKSRRARRRKSSQKTKRR